MRQFDFKLVFPCFFLTLALLTVPALAADAYVFPDSYCRSCGAAGILDESRSVAPTCTSKGVACYEDCSCGLRFLVVRLPALGHTPGQARVTVSPGCETVGYRVAFCDRCDIAMTLFGDEYAVELPALGHDFSVESSRMESTCRHPGYIKYSCARAYCTKFIYDPLPAPADEHIWGDPLPEKGSDPTCTASGIISYPCLICPVLGHDFIPALGHDWIENNRTGATVTAPGSVEYACTRCNETYTETVPQLPAPLPDPSPDDNLTLASLLQTLTEIFSMSCEWVGVVSSSVVSNPILLLGVIIGFIGTGAGLFRRLLNL